MIYTMAQIDVAVQSAKAVCRNKESLKLGIDRHATGHLHIRLQTPCTFFLVHFFSKCPAKDYYQSMPILVGTGLETKSSLQGPVLQSL